MTDGILKITHALLQCDSAPPPSSGEVYFPSSWIREGMWLFSPMEYSRSDAIRIARLHHKRENSFHSVCWNTYIWTPVPKACEESAYTEVVMLWGNQIKQRGHMQYLLIPAQGADMLVKKPLDDSSPQPLSHPKLQVFLIEALGIIEQRLTIPTVPCLNFWPTEPVTIKTWLPDNKLGSNSNWKNNLYSNSNWKNHQKTALNFK